MKPDELKTRIMERIEDGYWTPSEVLHCSECGSPVFEMSLEDIQTYMERLVAEGKAEWRDGRKSSVTNSGPTPQLCVPAGEPAGTDYSVNRPRGDENLVAKGER